MSSAFAGMSLLRKKEEENAGPKPLTEKAKQLQSYLAQQYGAGPAAAADKPKKKKKVKKSVIQSAVRIVDQDVTGFATKTDVAMGGDDDEGKLLHSSIGMACALKREMKNLHADLAIDDAEEPIVANAEEAEVLRQQAERERELLNRRLRDNEDGSGGWATVDEPPTTRTRPRQDSSEGDASPPRRRARHDSPDDASPPRRRARHDSPEHASPPRRVARHESPDDASPPRRRARHDSDDDASPPRRRHDSPDDASPPRRHPQHDADVDASPPRRRARHDSPGDASPPRRRAAPPADDEDLSPPRHKGGSEAGVGAQGVRERMSDGALAGMVSGRELMEEMARKREAERRRFEKLDPTLTGQAAATVFRDKSGRQVSKDEYLEAKAEERKKNKAQYDDESQLAWGGGLKQQMDREKEEQRMREEAALPFVRGHDARLDAEQRERLRWGDPMAHLVKKKIPELAAPVGLVEKRMDDLQKSGFVIPLEVPAHSWLRRGLGAPPNRYNIKPGRHWDGVDRSNGFERDMFKRQTELRRRNEEARMWAQGDM